jgi:hypothetical protein
MSQDRDWTLGITEAERYKLGGTFMRFVLNRCSDAELRAVIHEVLPDLPPALLADCLTTLRTDLDGVIERLLQRTH